MAAPDEPSSQNNRKMTFLMKLGDGYTFRSLVEVLCYINSEGIFVLGPQGCVYANRDDNKEMMVKVTISKRLMLSYFYETKEAAVPVYVSMGQLKDALKSVVRHDNLYVYQCEGDGNLYIGRGGKDVQYITTLAGGTIQTIEEPEYLTSVDSPSYVISTEELSQKFATTSRGPSDTTQATITDDGQRLNVDAMRARGSGSHVEICKTQTDAPSLGKPQVFKLGQPAIRLLSKISTLHKGPAQFYTQEGLPLKITCNVGTYGSLVVYINNVTTEFEERKREEEALEPVPFPEKKRPSHSSHSKSSKPPEPGHH